MQYLNKVTILFVITKINLVWFHTEVAGSHHIKRQSQLSNRCCDIRWSAHKKKKKKNLAELSTNFWVTFWSVSTHFHFRPPSNTKHTSQASFLFGRYIYSPGYSTYTHTLFIIQWKNISCEAIIHTNVVKQYAQKNL